MIHTISFFVVTVILFSMDWLLARALWCRRDVIILDEPLTGMDMEKRERILPQVVAMLKDRLVLLVTHEEDIARQFPHKELLIG